jgi:hypothetical protein
VTTAGVRGGGLPTLLTTGAPHTETWAEGHVRRGRAGWERVTFCRYCPKLNNSTYKSTSPHGVGHLNPVNECVDSRAFRHLCFFDDETLQNCAGHFLNLFWNDVDELERNRRRKRIDKSRPCNQLSDRRCVEAQGVRKRRWTFVASNVEPTVQPWMTCRSLRHWSSTR